MKTNELPFYDASENPTGCCPRFKPEGWDHQKLHFEDKPFVKVTTRNFFRIPINMGSVFAKTFKAIEEAGAADVDHFVVLSKDVSPWKGEHYFAVTKEVPGQDMSYLSGDFETHVFEGPYKEAGKWYHQLEDEIQKEGKQPEDIYFFYTTCPNCAKFYGKNYVVGFAGAS